MGKSQRLGVREVRDIYRLIGECRDIGGAPGSSAAWREHMFTGLRRMVDAQIAIGGEMWGLGTPGQRTAQTVAVGWSSTVPEKAWQRYEAEGANRRDPTLRPFAQIKGRVVTRRRCQLLDDREWYRSTVYNEYLKAGGVDDRIISFSELPAAPWRARRAINGITLHRAVGERPFEPRHVGLVHLFHHELAPLLGNALALVDGPGDRPLSPRLREVLDGLLAGDSEKRIAGRLHRSRHTVHEHVKRLYRHYGVASRSELLARFVKGRRHGR